MGWLSKFLKGSSAAAASSSSSWSSAKGKYLCSDDSDQSLSSSRNSNKDEETDSNNDGSGSPDVVDEKDEYLDHHSYGQDDQAGQLAAHIGGLSLEYPPTYNYNDSNNNYYLANVFQPYPFPSDDHSVTRFQGDGPNSWTDAFWQTEDSGRIQTYVGNEFAASRYDDTPRQYFGYSNQQHLICDICKQHIPVDSSGHIQVKEDHIWQLKYCRKHSKDGTATCYSCNRFEPMGTKYSTNEDGQKFCGDCNATAIMNIDECQPLIQEIYNFYQALDMKIYQSQIQIHVLHKKEMKTRTGSATIDGRTTFRESPSLYTTIRTPSFGSDNTTITGTNKKRFKLVSYKEVKKILLLSGCPRLYTGYVLAHEMMHAWLSLGGYVGADKTEGFVGRVETTQMDEGLCQVMAHKWLESQVDDEAISNHELDFETKLAQHLMRSIEERSDYDYGGGFRLVNPSVLKYGLKGTLDYIRMTGKFPL